MRIATIIGARPQFIKASAVSRALVSRRGWTEIIIHTGQHFDSNMSDIFFEELEIPAPDHHLGVSGSGHGGMTGVMLERLEPLLQEIRPDWVLVYGDTNSTLAGALTAVKLHIPVAHVEAGLRSYNRLMPEEINRIVTDTLSTLLFCPTETAVNNLRKEGFPLRIGQEKRQQVINSGDVMFNVAQYYAKKSEEKASLVLRKYSLQPKGYVLATVHRAENTDNALWLRAAIKGLEEAANEMPVVLPLHPRTRAALKREDIHPNKIMLIDPVGYIDMATLEMNAAVIATDSGGVQKEAFFHGVQCVTLREETEWIELLDSGWNRLAPPCKSDIADSIRVALIAKGKKVMPYGNGNAPEKILDMLAMECLLQ